MSKGMEYIQYYPDERLRSHSAQHVVDFFTEIGREGKLSDWQLRQSVDAIPLSDFLTELKCSASLFIKTISPFFPTPAD